jgi:hypothetical protein
LQDGVEKPDINNIREAFKSRQISPTDRFEAVNYAEISSKDVQLLFNTGKLTHIRDFHSKDWALVESDFFKETSATEKARKISGRVSGGIFQHKNSTQFIVALSYHGFKEKEPFAQGYLEGLLSNSES